MLCVDRSSLRRTKPILLFFSISYCSIKSQTTKREVSIQILCILTMFVSIGTIIANPIVWKIYELPDIIGRYISSSCLKASTMPSSSTLPHDQSAISISSGSEFAIAIPIPACRMIGASFILSPKAIVSSGSI